MNSEKPYLHCMKCRKCFPELDVKVTDIRQNGNDVVEFVCPACGTLRHSLRFNEEEAAEYGGIYEQHSDSAG